MIDLTIHYRAEKAERRQLPTVPHEGDYLDNAGRLWRVEYIVFNGPAVQVYCVELSPRLAGELQSAWSAWCGTEAPSRSSKGKTARRPGRPKQCDVCGESSTIRPCPVCAAKRPRLTPDHFAT